MSKDSGALYAEANEKQKEVDALRKQAGAKKQEELLATPLADRMVWAAYDRCPCGAGLAYDPADKGGVHGAWDCSDILLGKATPKDEPGSVQHTGRLPFAFYEIKSDTQPSANGASTRVKAAPAA